ncbi:phosphoserine phosphatase SerB [Pelagibacteraceae bacterium]|jgi:phosphoserine phosphatase|nr:phosphoserine phosphatase SerB [Pelagibacteraceae bacterium]
MTNKDQVVTLVHSNSLAIDDLSKYFQNSLSITINKAIKLSECAYDLYLESITPEQNQELRKKCYLEKIDICIQFIDDREKKILLSDMDATIIENETLDDLVKLSGVETNIDETSKLAMEGKIDIKTTLNTRLNYLKGKPKILINQVLTGIKFHPGSEVLVKTLNQKGFVTSLVTGGFAPISTFVGDRLGFQNVISNEFEFKDDCFTGEYAPITAGKNSKLNYLNKLTEEKNISKSQVVAIGDGANDLGMLVNSGLGVGYHAHQIVKDSVENQILFNDLTTLLYYLGISKNEFDLN